MAAGQSTYTPAQVSQINSSRAAAVSAGQNPYAGAGATAKSNAAGLQNLANSGTPVPTTPSDPTATPPTNTNTPNPQTTTATPATGQSTRDQAIAGLAAMGYATPNEKDISSYMQNMPPPQAADTGSAVKTGLAN